MASGYFPLNGGEQYKKLLQAYKLIHEVTTDYDFMDDLMGDQYDNTFSNGMAWGEITQAESLIFRNIKVSDKDMETMSYTIKPEGDCFVAYSKGFINLQESENYEFGDTPEEAREKLYSKLNGLVPTGI